MSPTGPSDFKLPDLRIVPSESLVPHEREDETRSGRLSERLRGSGVLKNPPVVTEGRAADQSACFVVLDGANRVSVARASELPHFLVQRVRYEDPGVELTAWNHALSGLGTEVLERELGRIPGLTLRREPLGQARALLARREAVAYAVTAPDEALTLLGDRELRARSVLLNAVVDVYRDRAPFYRVMSDSLAEARARFENVTALLVFPRFQPEEIVEIATSGARLPAGITRHVIPWRALRVNIPLELLADPNRTIEQKNQWLRTWLEERTVQKNIRFYQESTVLFDE
jgi:hypothetical protein